MPFRPKSTVSRQNNLQSANTARRLFNANPETKLSSTRHIKFQSPPLKKKRSQNSGYCVNRRKSIQVDNFFLGYCISPVPINSPSITYDKVIKPIHGNMHMLLYGLSTMEKIFASQPGISLTKCSKIASDSISSEFIQVLAPSTLFKHWKRLFHTPESYDGTRSIFPVSSGDHQTLSNHLKDVLIQNIRDRINDKSLPFPNIKSFILIGFSLTGHKYSSSWMSRFLRSYSISYKKPEKGKIGTRYHDSPINIKERILFLLLKIWYISFEQINKCHLFIHDESWINEKPNGNRIWTGKGCVQKCKLEGRRFAFASL